MNDGKLFFCSEPPTRVTVQPSTKYKIVPIFILVATYNVQDYVLGPQNIVKRERQRMDT